MYSISGRSAATAAAEFVASAVLWNGHTSQRIRVIRMLWTPVTAPNVSKYTYVYRFSARGTPTVTVTPGAQNHSRYGVAPASEVVLDLDWSVEPTIADSLMTSCESAAAGAGSGGRPAFWPGVIVPPGYGLGFVSAGAATAAFPACEVTFVWEEDF